MKITGPNIILLSVFIIMISTSTWALDNDPPTPGTPAPPPGLVVPLDTNIYFLLVAGLGLGIYFLRASWKKSTSIH